MGLSEKTVEKIHIQTRLEVNVYCVGQNILEKLHAGYPQIGSWWEKEGWTFAKKGQKSSEEHPARCEHSLAAKSRLKEWCNPYNLGVLWRNVR